MTDAKGATAPGFQVISLELCGRCNGDGYIEAGFWPCPDCRGLGMVDYDEFSELTDEYDEQDEDLERESGDG